MKQEKKMFNGILVKELREKLSHKSLDYVIDYLSDLRSENNHYNNLKIVVDKIWGKFQVNLIGDRVETNIEFQKRLISEAEEAFYNKNLRREKYEELKLEFEK